MKRKRILFLIPSLVGGGAERTLINLLDKIDYSLYDITIITVLKKGDYLNQIPNEINIKYLFKNEFIFRLLSFLQKKTGFDSVFSYKMKHLLDENYEVGICFLDSNFTDLLFMTEKIKKRYTWVHSSYVSNPNFSDSYKNLNYREKLIKERYSKLDGIIFVSDNSRKEFIEIFGDYPKMEVIYNLINNDAVIRRSEEKLDFEKEKFRFVAIGSLFKVKGYDRLIKASAILKDRGFDFEVIIAGKGNEEKQLKSLVRKYNVERNIRFTGFINNPYPLLKSADVFIMTSLSEGLPTVLCEAMILGVPTLVTNCSGCTEIVGNGEFGLMSDQNVQSIAENMTAYLESIDLISHYNKKSTERSLVFNDQLILNRYYTIFDN